MTARLPWMVAVSLFATLGTSFVSAEEPLVLTADTQLDPGKTYGRIIIRASNLVIDGRGAKLVGTADGDPSKYSGTAITADGVSNVTLRNVSAHGWETGLHLANGAGWTVENCDFSDNFHDPKFGWGENGRRGGILLENVRESVIRGCKANRVWDACVLVGSQDNRLEKNDFSRTSNTCLKLWDASRNAVEDNNLSYGIRKDPGEVHARDSTSVLIESGSNDNRFLRNDCRYGGDGIFIRVLNGWVSTGNYFEENDCSYANNNCIEAWSPRNTWVKNKANHGSYGFWLGASDQNVLLDNEASFNGLAEGNHNSPHLPGEGHAGIVFMFGPSSHTLLRGNRCESNNGAGIAAIGDLDSNGKKWNAFHWVIDQNELIGNRWGVFLQNAEMFDLAANTFRDNRDGNVHNGGNLAGVIEHPSVDGVSEAPRAKLAGPSTVTVGVPVTFDASASSDRSGRELNYRWRLQPAAEAEGAQWTLTFPKPGFYRLALTVNNGLLSDLAWRDVYAVDEGPELVTVPAQWDWIDAGSQAAFAVDPAQRLVGADSLRAEVRPYSGGRVTLRCQLPDPVAVPDNARLGFWLKTRNENVPAWQDVNPVITLTGEAGDERRLTPRQDLLSAPPYIEAREGWTWFSAPLAGDETWIADGVELRQVRSLSFGFDSWGAPPLVIWIDGLGIR